MRKNKPRTLPKLETATDTRNVNPKGVFDSRCVVGLVQLCGAAWAIAVIEEVEVVAVHLKGFTSE